MTPVAVADLLSRLPLAASLFPPWCRVGRDLNRLSEAEDDDDDPRWKPFSPLVENRMVGGGPEAGPEELEPEESSCSIRPFVIIRGGEPPPAEKKKRRKCTHGRSVCQPKVVATRQG